MRLSSLTRVRLLGLHPFTWFMGLVIGTGLVLIEVPGVKYGGSGKPAPTRQWREGGQHHKVFQWSRRAGEPYKNTSIGSFEYYDHGWPCYYMSRAIHLREYKENGAQNVPSKPAIEIPWFNPRRQEIENVPVEWSNFDSWPIRFSSWRIHYGYLALDLAVVLAMFAIAVGGTEAWLRRRGGLFRFRIVHMLLIMAACAMLGAWAESHRRFQSMEARMTQLSHMQASQPIILIQGYSGPYWLKLLVGNEKFLPIFYHTTAAKLYINTTWKTDSADLFKLRYLQDVSILGAIPSSTVRDLSQLPRLEDLDLHFLEISSENNSNFPASAQEYSELLRVASEQELFSAADLEHVTKLPLKELRLDGIALSRDDVARIGSMRSLRWLELSVHDVAAEDIEWLRQTYPHLEIELSNRPR